MDPQESGRGDWIRTSDPLRPRQVRYQAALRPVPTIERTEGVDFTSIPPDLPRCGLAGIADRDPKEDDRPVWVHGSRVWKPDQRRNEAGDDISDRETLATDARRDF
jgi:hypothetical protein